MIRVFFLSVCLLIINSGYGQISGTVTDISKKPLPYVSIYIENTFNGTTSNDNGEYELNISTPKQYTIVFKFLGYKTLKKQIDITEFPYELDVELREEEISLSEVLIKAEENPANAIIRSAIDNRKSNLNKINSYKANFYSRGLIRIKEAPEKILGQELGDLGGGLDSTRSGIIYLSETISKLQYLRPGKLKETITASKVSGNDNGFSFNAASDVDFNFYRNTIELGNEIVSPISEFAFNYYRYKLEGIFYDDRGNLINKIQVIPKRENDPIFSGFIYIVEDIWSIYALELKITGQQANIPAADEIMLKQTFSYSEADDIWALISQRIDFEYSILGIKGSGAFTAVYSDYIFNSEVTRKSFSNEILSFENEANKKDSLYWEDVRPVPLTDEEIKDYVRKDSIQILRKSKPYLDSIDARSNGFKLFDLISGYTYQNSYNDYRFGIGSPIEKLKFNTVQGFNTQVNLFYNQNYDEFRRYIRFNAILDYGFSDERLRPRFNVTFKFNNIKRNTLGFSGGLLVQQYNTGLSSLERLNSFYSLLAEKNYLKVFENRYAQINYTQEITNGFNGLINISYQNRLPLFNTTDQVWYNQNDRNYTSNNPIEPENYNSAPFLKHSLLKFNATATINFGQTYMSFPDSKFNINNPKYPTLSLSYEKGFASDIEDYNYDQVKGQLFQTVNLSNKGSLRYNFKGGLFFNAEEIAFMDYQHFNGNQTNIGTTSRYTNVFNNLPYYALSTNKSYFEAHVEHDFKGYIMGKIPLLNKLNYNLILGAHTLATEENLPYREYSVGLDNIGFGKFRLLRLDYVRSYQKGYKSDALIFGLKFLNFID